MSEDVTKSALRLRLPELDGMSWNEAYAFFVAKIGQPVDVDEYEGEIQYFSYAPKRVRNKPSKDYYEPIKDGDKWGVDFVFEYGYPYECEGLNETIVDIQTCAEKMAGIFGKEVVNVRVVCSTWYNGVDEPISFEEEK